MTSNSKMFKKYLFSKASTMRASLKDQDFIADCRTEWKMMSDIEKTHAIGDHSGPQPKTNDPNVANGEQAMANDGGGGHTSGETTDPKGGQHLKRVLSEKLMQELVDFKTRDELMATKVYFMASNIQCIVDGEYRPLEIGFVEYTIRDGIQKAYHSFIDCQEIPYGFAFASIDHMKRSHKIPITDFEWATKDYVSVGNQVLDLLDTSRVEIPYADRSVDKHPMIVFSLWDQKPQNEGVLKWLADRHTETCGVALDWNIVVLDVSDLLMAIHLKYGQRKAMKDVREELSTTSFDYSLGTDCHFHEEIQCIVCAQGVAKRMAYVMSQSLINVLQFKPLATHFPTVQINKHYIHYQFISKAFKDLKLEDEKTEDLNANYQYFD
ncbi:unnamed protein product [Medioppia subpectinata]|uniref:Maelstrom domain-containing protein n=1 Tax=Medioppia subpectinata TaxID=1979941 RepID=A0A7R9KR18_9ACAR|nr:unnamed protein product [Medioppia subpectinata]CAG2108196.1 unnamed protein product [Medioppia subpectinata]